MRKAKVLVNGIPAGILEEQEKGRHYRFSYYEDYGGEPVSLTMPVTKRTYEYNTFPPFFDGLLPEGVMLEGLLKQRKVDKDDLLSQLIAVGEDMVGSITVEEI